MITLGGCAKMNCSFEKTFAIVGNIENHIPVAHHIEGCPPEPKDIIRGFLEFFKKIS